VRIPLAVGAAVAAAEVAVLLLRPREGIVAPAPVSAGSYLSRSCGDACRAAPPPTSRAEYRTYAMQDSSLDGRRASVSGTCPCR
jgi:hypothetical protein